MNVTEELAHIKERVRRYRASKESELSEQGNPSSASDEVIMNKRFTQAATKEDVSRVLDVDCIIAPFIPLRDGAWPMALISSSIEKCADLGSMESTGSLWKIVRKVFADFGIRGTTVILQSSEIGEKAQYLTPTLALTADMSAAAIWLVKIQPVGEAGHHSHDPDNASDVVLKPTTAFGTLLQFVLVPRNSDGTVDATDALVENSSRTKMLVAARATSGSGEKGVAILSESERNASADSFHWTLTWQVTREDSAIDGFAFLDTVDLDFAV